MDEQSKKYVQLLEQKKKEVVEDNTALSNLILSLQSVFERYYTTQRTGRL